MVKCLFVQFDNIHISTLVISVANTALQFFNILYPAVVTRFYPDVSINILVALSA